MRPKTYLYLGISLDGYIAGKEGDISWLERIPAPVGNDMGFSEFLERIDCLLMGRKTFDVIRDFQELPYGNKKIFILSQKGLDLPDHWKKKAEVISGDPEEILSYLGNRGYKNIYLDGGITVRQFLSASLLDEMILTTLPILVGGGVRLFEELNSKQEWILLSSRTFENGFVQSRYSFKEEF